MKSKLIIGAFVMAVMVQVAQGAAGVMYWRCTNAAPQQLGYEIWKNGIIMQGKTGVNPGTSSNSSRAENASYVFKIYYPYTGSLAYTSPAYVTTDGNNQTWAITWTGQPDPTYYWACITITNPCPSSEIANIAVYVDGSQVGVVQQLIPAHGTYTKCLTNDVAFTWNVVSLFNDIERECQLPPQNGGSDQETQPPPAPGNDTDPGGGDTGKGPIDPTDAVGTNIVNDPNLTQQQSDRQLMAWLIQELNRMFAELYLRLPTNGGSTIDYRPWLNRITNQLDLIYAQTNIDYRIYWTNQYNQMLSLTNDTKRMIENMGAISNMLYGIVDTNKTFNTNEAYNLGRQASQDGTNDLWTLRNLSTNMPTIGKGANTTNFLMIPYTLGGTQKWINLDMFQYDWIRELASLFRTALAWCANLGLIYYMAYVVTKKEVNHSPSATRRLIQASVSSLGPLAPLAQTIMAALGVLPAVAVSFIAEQYDFLGIFMGEPQSTWLQYSIYAFHQWFPIETMISCLMTGLVFQWQYESIRYGVITLLRYYTH